MLLIRMSPGPNTTVGRTIAHEIVEPLSSSVRSTSRLPTKYGRPSFAPSSGFVIETWTIRRTPASAAAAKSALELRIASANVRPRCSNRIQ